MKPAEVIALALARCPAVQSRSLGEFLGSLLDLDLDALAELPGTPGQVLAAQFTHYARSSMVLTETVRRNGEAADRLVDALLRLPTRAKGRCAHRRQSHGSRASDSQAISV